MEYSKIIAITGLPGLFELISSKSDGGIVRSLEDKSTRFVSSRVHQFSHLESIEVYSTRHNENLVTVLNAMENSGEKLPDEKDPGALKAYFEKVFPTLDHSRVYNSDLRKMVKWFSLLRDNAVEIKLSEPAEEAVEEPAEEPEKKQPAPEKAAKEKAAAPPPEEKKAAKKLAVKTTEEKKAEKKPGTKTAASKEEGGSKTLKKAPVKKAAASKSKVEKKSADKSKSKKAAPKKK